MNLENKFLIGSKWIKKFNVLSQKNISKELVKLADSLRHKASRFIYKGLACFFGGKICAEKKPLNCI